jgi:peptide/nickel transport system substrate-binding protein
MSGLTRRTLLKGAKGANAGAAILLAGCNTQQGGNTGGNSDSNASSSSQQPDEVVSVELLTTTASYAPTRFEIMQLIAEEFRALGIQVNLRARSFNEVISMAAIDHEHQLLGIQYGGLAERLDPDDFLYTFLHSSSIEGGQNLCEYSSEAFDKATEAQRRTFDHQERQNHAYEAQRVLAEDVPMITFITPDLLVPYRSDRFEKPPTLTGEGLMSFWTAIGIQPKRNVREFRLGYPSDIGNLNPMFGGTQDNQTYRLIYDKLMRIRPDSLEPEPWAAESVDLVDDTTIDVTLRNGMTWHDGEDVTVEDVKFSYEYQAQNSPRFEARIKPIDTVEITGNNRLQFNLGQPYSPIFAQTFSTVYLLPEHIWSDVPGEVEVDEATEWSNANPVGSGPFQFEHWRQNEELRLSRFDGHFSPPNIETLIKIPGSDLQSLIRFVEAGNIDAIGFTHPPQTAERFQDANEITVINQSNHGPSHLSFQTNKPPGDDKAFRQAVAHAIPRRDIVDTVLRGAGTVESDSIITTPNEVWHDPNLKQRSYNPEQARQLLTDAGYTYDDQDRLHYPA